MARHQEGLSIICISFFSGHLIPKLLDNIRQVIKGQMQIIIVNNAGAFELIEPGTENVNVINSSENLGYGGGINLGLKHANYENILIINPDIEITEYNWNPLNHDMLFLAGAMQLPESCGYVFPSLCRDSLGYVIPNFRKFLRKKISCFPNRETNVDWFSGNLIMTNKKTLDVLNGFDESYFLFYEEVDLFKRASRLGIMVFISPKVKYSPLQVKASSIDVYSAKIIHELNSFAIYHKKYSRGHQPVFYLLKMVFLLYAGLLSSIGVIIKNHGIQRLKNNYKNRHEQISHFCRKDQLK